MPLLIWFKSSVLLFVFSFHSNYSYYFFFSFLTSFSLTIYFIIPFPPLCMFVTHSFAVFLVFVQGITICILDLLESNINLYFYHFLDNKRSLENFYSMNTPCFLCHCHILIPHAFCIPWNSTIRHAVNVHLHLDTYLFHSSLFLPEFHLPSGTMFFLPEELVLKFPFV